MGVRCSAAEAPDPPSAPEQTHRVRWWHIGSGGRRPGAGRRRGKWFGDDAGRMREARFEKRTATAKQLGDRPWRRTLKAERAAWNALLYRDGAAVIDKEIISSRDHPTFRIKPEGDCYECGRPFDVAEHNWYGPTFDHRFVPKIVSVPIGLDFDEEDNTEEGGLTALVNRSLAGDQRVRRGRMRLPHDQWRKWWDSLPRDAGLSNQEWAELRRLSLACRWLWGEPWPRVQLVLKVAIEEVQTAFSQAELMEIRLLMAEGKIGSREVLDRPRVRVHSDWFNRELELPLLRYCVIPNPRPMRRSA